MASATHILDTSAILAHYFEEPGADEVDSIWQQHDNKPAICVLTVPELKTRLEIEVASKSEAKRAFELYTDQLTLSLPVDRVVADEAARLREISSVRLPLVDACIAGCAKRFNCILVHCDPHMDGLPVESVRQLRLPDRA